jgi:hypothetical protein
MPREICNTKDYENGYYFFKCNDMIPERKGNAKEYDIK